MQAKADKKKRTANKRRKQIVQTMLTWGHIITMSVLALAVLCNVGSLAAIVFRPEVAAAVTEYAKAWQPFFIAGILGYDAKSTVENAMKITNTIKSEQDGEEAEDEENG